MSGIKMSPKYGVNPSISKCFWCGESKGLVLFGRINPDKKRGRAAEDLEAPRECIVDYEPCDKCAEQFNKGVMIFACSAFPRVEGMPAITNARGTDMYPTGQFAVVKTETVNRMFDSDYEDGERIACDESMFNHMIGD